MTSRFAVPASVTEEGSARMYTLSAKLLSAMRSWIKAISPSRPDRS